MKLINDALIMLFHPSDGFHLLKKSKTVSSALVMYLLVGVVHIASILITHQPLRTVDPRTANLFLEAAKLWIPLISFVVVSYGLSTLGDGEAKLRDVFIGTAFCMLPYVLLTVPIALVSLIMAGGEAMFFHTLNGAVWVWVAYLFYRQLNVLNNYTFPQTIGLIVLTGIGMLIMWALIVLLYLLTSNIFSFIQDVILEAVLYFS